jgi:hypothetical protein
MIDMKKNLIYMLALATTMLAACDNDDYTDWAAPQQNGAEDAQSVTFSAASAPAIDYNNIADGDSVLAFVPTVQAEEGATTAYELTFSNGSTINAGSDGKVLADELRTVIEDLYGKRPEERALDTEVAAYVTVNGQAVKRAATVTITATLTAPVIESKYYYVGQSNNWNENDDSEEFIFSHSDTNVYDDPEFTIVVPAPYDDEGNRKDMWFKVSPLSAHGTWNGLLGCETDGDESLTGKLVVDGGSMNMPADDGATMYRIVINMMDYTYTVTPLNFTEYIYVVGNPSWDATTAVALRSAKYDGEYTGYAKLDGNFKFIKVRGSWTGQYNSTDFTSYVGGCAAAGDNDNNISQPTAGYYYINANAASATLTTTLVSKMSIIGSVNGSWDTDTYMTWDDTNEVWTLENVELAAGEMKFRANDRWDINLGGTADDLEPNGANLTIAEAGTYTITLHTIRTVDSGKIYCTIDKK